MLAESMRSDLIGMVDDLSGADVFRPGEAEGWREDIREAKHVSDLMMLNEAMVDTLAERESFQKYMDEIEFERVTPPAAASYSH